MKKNATEKTTNEKQLKKIDAEKLKKQKAREAKKAKRLALIEKHKKQVEANKIKRAEKKAKKLAKLEKIKAKKLLIKQKKQEARQKKLERLAKQKAKAKELKLKMRAKAKLEKQKIEKTPKSQDTIGITVKLLKDYIKALAKDTAGITDKQIKKLEKLGFAFNDDTVSFTLAIKRKIKKQVAVDPEVVEVADAEPNEIDSADIAIESAIDEAIDGKSDAIEALAAELEADDSNSNEVPVGDTFTDNVVTDPLANDDQPNGFENDEDEDDTYDDHRDENDDDKVDFRRDWNNEFGEDGERNDY